MSPTARGRSEVGRGERLAAHPGRRLRVLLACDHIDHDGALHGAGRQLVELTRGLLERDGVRPSVVVLRGASGLGRKLQDEGLPFTFLEHGRFNPTSLWSLLRTIRRQGTDLVHLTDFGACTFGRLAAKAAGVPAVVHVRSHHSEYQPRGYPRYVEYAYRSLAPLTARTIAISRTVRDFAVSEMGLDPDRIEILNNPLARFSFSRPADEKIEALRRELGIAEGDPVVGTVTRFHEAKGNRYLITAFARVLERVPSAWLVLVGEGPERESLMERARALGIAERVLFTGFRRDVEAHYCLFTVSTVPSVEEGFGNVAVEAMALSVPVVASKLGGLQEIVTHGRDGLLVPPADPEALSRALLAILEDPEARDRMGRAARARSEDFSLDRYLDRLEALYRDVVAERDGRGR